MGKTALKWRIRDDWRIGEHESWLRDMALDGLFLKKVGRLFCRFEKSEPRQMRYRIIPVRDIPMTLQQKKAGAPNGWDFVTSFRIFYVYSSPQETAAPEFPISPAEYAKNLNRAGDRIIIGLMYLAVSILSIIQSVAGILNSQTPYLALLDEVPANFAIALTVFAYALYLPLSALISTHKLRKSLLAGNPIDHEAPWQKNRRAALAGTVAAFVILVSVVAFSLTQTSVDMSPEKPLSSSENSLPIVWLADIENNSDLVREEGHILDGVDYNNNIQQASNLLAPIQIKSEESGVIKTEKWKDGSGEYTPSISNTVYKLAFPFMADKVMADLIFYYEDIFKTTEDYNPCREISSPYFDRLFVSEINGYFVMFAVKGDVVVHITYGGNAGSDTIIKAATEKVALILD